VSVTGGTIKQVQFFVDGAPLNTELEAPYNCVFDTTKLSDGSHVLKAVATDTSGATGSTQVSVNVQNGTSGGGGGGTPGDVPSGPRGAAASSQVSVNVQDGPSGGVGAGTPGDVPSGLLFWSGFDGNITFGTPSNCYSKGCWQEMGGTDSVTGFSWPPNVGGSS